MDLSLSLLSGDIVELTKIEVIIDNGHGWDLAQSGRVSGRQMRDTCRETSMKEQVSQHHLLTAAMAQ